MFITGHTLIGDLLDNHPELESVLLEYGMHCPGCPAARGETILEACEVHGINPETLLNALNRK